MAQSFYGSFCLETLFGQFVQQDSNGNKWVNISALQGAHIQRPNNGNTYVNIGVSVNDQQDSYGNIAGITLSQSKEDREAKAKRVYIGNLKASRQQAAPAAQQAQAGPYNPYAPQASPQQAAPHNPYGAPANPYAQGQPMQGQTAPQGAPATGYAQPAQGYGQPAPQQGFQPTPMGPAGGNGNLPF